MVTFIITLDQLKLYLREKSVRFKFQKADGTYREALGTLNTELIPENMKPKENSKSLSNLRFYDLEKNEWRSIGKNVKEVEVL